MTSLGTTPAGTNPYGLAIDPTGRFCFVTNTVSDTVQAYTINQSTGALTSVGTTATGTIPIDVAVDPTGRFCFVVNLSSLTVQTYTINQSTGALTSVGTTATNASPIAVAVDPTGRFCFVVNRGSNNVGAYTINQSTGALTLVSQTPAGGTPHGVAVDPTGRFCYVTNYGVNSVQTYTIEQSTGVLIHVGYNFTASSPMGIAVDPYGRFCFATVRNANRLQAYRIQTFHANSGVFLDRLIIGSVATPAYTLHLASDSAAKPTSNTWTISSDERIKTIIAPYERGLADVIALQPKRYRLNGMYGTVDDGLEHVSVIAQEAQLVWPEMIGAYPATSVDAETQEETSIDLLTLNTNSLQWGMVNAIKQLAAANAALASRVAVLETNDAAETPPSEAIP